ncbi:MAG TPA: type II toxin-antitoxin system RelE/ParE family toxin [Tepidisphaeraceae bacterium]|nr:type II toxin-antitoxin system RelE/ParE family toxin [Tepidisphaeraceae bacterium]
MNPLTVQYLPAAWDDLRNIFDHIAESSPQNAHRVIDAVESAVASLSRMPGMGHRRRDVSDARYRFWTVHSFVIAFRFDETKLVIVRVVHGARDFRRLF